jgi:hypothetical protein
MILCAPFWPAAPSFWSQKWESSLERCAAGVAICLCTLEVILIHLPMTRRLNLSEFYSHVVSQKLSRKLCKSRGVFRAAISASGGGHGFLQFTNHLGLLHFVVAAISRSYQQVTISVTWAVAWALSFNKEMILFFVSLLMSFNFNSVHLLNIRVMIESHST